MRVCRCGLGSLVVAFACHATALNAGWFALTEPALPASADGSVVAGDGASRSQGVGAVRLGLNLGAADFRLAGESSRGIGPWQLGGAPQRDPRFAMDTEIAERIHSAIADFPLVAISSGNAGTSPSPIPEPLTVLLLTGVGLALLVFRRRRPRQARG